MAHFLPGEIVKGRFSDGEWYLATIELENTDGTYSVAWFDGDTSNCIKHSYELKLMQFDVDGGCYREVLLDGTNNLGGSCTVETDKASQGSIELTARAETQYATMEDDQTHETKSTLKVVDNFRVRDEATLQPHEEPELELHDDTEQTPAEEMEHKEPEEDEQLKLREADCICGHERKLAGTEMAHRDIRKGSDGKVEAKFEQPPEGQMEDVEAEYECEFSCGFIGTFEQVSLHEKGCSCRGSDIGTQALLDVVQLVPRDDPIEVIVCHAVDSREIKVHLPARARFKHIKLAMARCMGGEEFVRNSRLMKKEGGLFRSCIDSDHIVGTRRVLLVRADLKGCRSLEASLQDEEVTSEEEEC